MKTKNKVLAYITRTAPSGTRELLVFDHRDYPEAGTQVPAGTVEREEFVASALLREVWEESGIRLEHPGKLLGCYDWYREDLGELHKRHVFHIVREGLENGWSHTVSGTGEDEDLVFQYFWIDLSSASARLAANQGDYLAGL